MTPQPKRRHSRARSGKRRASISLTEASFTPCPNCAKMKLSHAVCPSCGVYSGRVVVAPEVKTTVKKLTPVTPEIGATSETEK